MRGARLAIRLAYPMRLGLAHARTGGDRLALVLVGIVAGSAAMAAVLGGTLVMQDRSVARETAKLPAAERSLAVAWFGSFEGTWRSLDRAASSEILRVTGRIPTQAMLYREASVDGRFINLRAANGLAAAVHLISGRLPTTCTETRCEVLRIIGPGIAPGPIPSKTTLRLIEVGRARLDRSAPFADYIQPETTGIVTAATQYHRPQASPVVLADGVQGLSRMAELSTFFRSYAWFVPMRNADVHPWSVNTYRAQVEELRAKLGATSDRFQVTAPTDKLTAALASSRVAARRLLLLGGEAGALLLAFTVLAASALRRSTAEARRRLRFAGARTWQVELHTLSETGTVAVGGTVVGWCLGGLVTGLVASAAGSPAWQTVTHSVLAETGLLAAGGVAAAATVLIYLTVRAGDLRLGRLAITPLDVAALAAAATVGVGYMRGDIGSGTLAASSGTGAFVLLVPALVTFTAAIVAARLLVPLVRQLGRVGKRGPIALRLASVSLARTPGPSVVVATFLVASLELALFAATYRSTLLAGQRDEAAYAAPAPYVIREDISQLVPVLHSWHGATATPIIRLTGNVPSAASLTFLGIPWNGLEAVGGWRNDFSTTSRAQLAKALEPTGPTTLVTTALPPGHTFSLLASTEGDSLIVRALFRSPLGDVASVNLGRVDEG